MLKHGWMVNIEGQDHAVEVQRSRWSNAGEILVDGQVVEAWGLDFNLSQRKFSIAGQDAIIRWPGIISQKCELFVGGDRVKVMSGKA